MAETTYTEAQLQEMLAQTREAMLQLPGVVAVGFGCKESQGVVTDTICWRVYVQKKAEPATLAPEHTIPATYLGFPTDVIELVHSDLRSPCEDANSYSPLVGGATISNLVAAANGTLGEGTVAFFATIDGNADNKSNVVLVTNNHVIAINGAASNATVYQPYREATNGVSQIKFMVDADGTRSATQRHEALGPISNIGRQYNHKFLYGDEANPATHQGYWVDAGTVKIDFSISSCCDTHCGVKFKPETHGLNINNGNSLDGYERVKMSDLIPGPYLVWKWGHRTSDTAGRVIDCVGPANPAGQSAFNTIWVISTQPNCDGNMVFSDVGDSGAAIINIRRKVVGILFSGNLRTVPGIGTVDVTFCSHIHPTLDYLKVTPITTAVPHPYMSTKSDSPGVLGEESLHALQYRLRETPLGATLLQLFAQHRAELTELVNHCRPVTVAWHRHQGPGFTNRIIANSRNPEVLIPEAIEGVTLRQLGEAMYPLILAHGSPALRSAVEAHAATLLPLAEGLRSLHTLVSSLNPAEHE